MRGFTALDIPEELKHRLEEVQNRMPNQNLSMTTKESMHITIHFFDDVREEQIEVIKKAMDLIQTGEFEVVVRGISYFGDKRIRVVFAKVEDHTGTLLKIFNEIAAALADANIPFDKKEKYTPHITIAKPRGNNSLLKKFIDENSDHNFGHFIATKISFKQSVLTDKGSVHTLLYEHKI